MEGKNFTRRDFLKTGVIATGAMLLNNPIKLFAAEGLKSKVILLRNQNIVDAKGNVNSKIMQKMIDEAVTVLFDTKDAQSAWEKIIKPSDVVGIKTNKWDYLHTPTELEEALQKRVIETGVSKENISIDDRGIFRNPIFKKATALINTRPMRTHYWSGVGTLIKNYIMFAEKPSDYHPDSCADLAAVWKLPNVNGKTKLNVLVMLTPLFHSVGPHGFSEEYLWQYKGIIVGTDPVACDAVGLKIIEAKRKEFFGEDKPLNPPAKHIELADTRHHLGTADSNKIELVKIGWKENILI